MRKKESQRDKKDTGDKKTLVEKPERPNRWPPPPPRINIDSQEDNAESQRETDRNSDDKDKKEDKN